MKACYVLAFWTRVAAREQRAVLAHSSDPAIRGKEGKKQTRNLAKPTPNINSSNYSCNFAEVKRSEANFFCAGAAALIARLFGKWHLQRPGSALYH
jgi:hypothetical protein